MAASMSSPMNASATGSQGPSSTHLASIRTRRVLSQRAPVAAARLTRPDFPAPGSPAVSRLVDEVEGDVLAELVDADEHRVEHRHARPDGHPIGAERVTGNRGHGRFLR